MKSSSNNEESVIFLEDLSEQEEFDLVFNATELKRTLSSERTNGNALLPSNPILPQRDARIKYDTLKISESTTMDYTTILTLALLSIEPFYNLLETFYTKTYHTSFVTINTIYWLILKNSKNELDLSHYKIRYSNLQAGLTHNQILNELLFLIHDDFLKEYFFQVNDWLTPSMIKNTNKTDKQPDISPIIDFFGCNVANTNDKKIDKSLCVYLKPSCDRINIQSALKAYIYNFKRDKDSTKYPTILSIIPTNDLDIEEIVALNHENYRLNSFITTTDKGFNLYVKYDDDHLVLKCGQIQKIDNITNYEGSLVIIFYSKMEKNN